MGFPEHIDRIFEAFGIAADTKAALYDLYVTLGPDALEVFSDIAEGVELPADLRPEHCANVRTLVVERYLRRNHPLWLAGTPTPSLYRPRELEGRAAGVAIPLGAIGVRAPGPHSPGVSPGDESNESDRAGRPIGAGGTPALQELVGDDQPIPDGIVVQGRNAHFGGRHETVSFDLVAADLDDALAIGTAQGQQHTIPGSVGETSGTLDAPSHVALLWEIQPNVYKPAGERNRAIAKLYRRHRNWHIITLVAALDWLRAKSFRIFVVRGEALAATHEVNPAKPVSPAIVALHNRTVERVTAALGLDLHPATRDEEQILLNSSVMNVSLSKHVSAFGARDAIWRIG